VNDFPRPGEVDTIMARAKVRRGSRATAAALGGTAVLLLVATLAAGTARPRAQLDPAGTGRGRRATVSGTASPAPTPTRAIAPPPRSATGGSVASGPGAPPPGEVAPSGVPAPPANGGDPPTRPYADRPALSKAPMSGSGANCQPRIVDPAHPSTWIANGAWCLRLLMSSADTEHVYDVYVDVCRDVDAAPASLYFPTALEVDFAVRTKAGHEVWRWSRGQVFPQTAHTVLVDRGSCYRWTVTYDGTDDYGAPLARGTYLIRTSVVTPDFKGKGTVEMRLDVM
jgi:hypothetical protein